MKTKNLIHGILLITSMLLMLVLPAYAISGSRISDEDLQRLISALEAKRIEHNIAGMAIAVVKDDTIILSQGFGLMDLANKQAVTAETLFAIGSSTKAFTATLAAMQVDQGNMSWDDEVTQYLPDYQFIVKDKPLPITLRDMLSHRTGYTRNDLLWANGQASREHILTTATQAQQWDDFRKNFHYNNVMYLAAGEVTAHVAGQSWDQLLQQSIFKPLGMKATTSIHESAIANTQISLGYQWNDATESHDLMPRRNLNNVAPAGGIYSNVADMAQWLRLLLNKGQIGEHRLVSAEQLQATWEPVINISDSNAYGMGWFLQEWQGKKVIEHGGSIDGYGAQVTLLPEENLGYVLLTNNTASPLQQESIHVVLEHLVKQQGTTQNTTADKKTEYSEYVGEYQANFASFKDQLFTFLIKDNGQPAIDVPGQMVYELKQPNEEGKWYFAITDTVAVSFDRNDKGAIIAMRMHQNRMDFELPKKGIDIKPEIDAIELQTYLGQYQSKTFNGTINAIIQNHRLTLDVPNQMAFELHLPDAQGFRQFRIKADMSAKFETDEHNKVTKLLLYRDRSKVVDTAAKMSDNQTTSFPEVDEVLALMNTKKQKKALRKKSGFKLSGTINMLHSGVSGTITTAFEANQNYFQRMDYGTFGEILVTANELSAATKGINPYTEFKGKYLKQIHMDHPAVMFDISTHADDIKIQGISELNERKVYVLRVKINELPTRTYYVDAETGDTVKFKSMLLNPVVGSLPVSIEYSDFQKQHGLRLPMKITIKNPMMGQAVIHYNTFEAKQKFSSEQFRIKP